MSTPWTPLLLVIGVAWICAFPISYFATAMLRYPRPRRFARPLALWSAVAVPLAVVMMVEQPWLVWVGLGYAVAFCINVAFARMHDERSLANDLVFIIECTAIVPVMWAVGADSNGWQPPPPLSAPTTMWVSTIACALVLIGSTLHVKSLIRERTDPRYRSASHWWAVACVPVSIAFAIILGLPAGAAITLTFLYLALRAFLVGQKPLSPGRIGMIELAGFVLLAIAFAIAAA